MGDKPPFIPNLRRDPIPPWERTVYVWGEPEISRGETRFVDPDAKPTPLKYVPDHYTLAYLELKQLAGTGFRCVISVSQLASRIQYSKRGTYSALKGLRKRHMIDWIQRKNERGTILSSIYIILPEAEWKYL